MKEKQEKGRPSNLARVTKVVDNTQLKILTPKQMLQRLPTALAQVKAGNTSENLLNEIKKKITKKEITKKVYNNIMNSIKL